MDANSTPDSAATDTAPADTSTPAGDDAGGGGDELSIFGLMQKAETETPVKPSAEDAGDNDDGEDDLEDEDEPEEAAKPEKKPVEDKKPVDEKKPDELPEAAKEQIAALEQRGARATKAAQHFQAKLHEAEHHIAQYETAFEVLQQDNERLVALLQEAKLVDERDLQLRKYELDAEVQRRLGEADKVYAQRLEQAKVDAQHQAKVAFYEREIPKALKAFPLVSEAELCAAIERLPRGAQEDIPALAKMLHDTRLREARRLQTEQRKARRALPASSNGRAPPIDFTADAAGFAQLLARGKPGH
jgi:hypothetical protein